MKERIATMGHFSTFDFVGTRTRFQRFSDSKLFHGWIENFSPSYLVIRTDDAASFHEGDRYIFHASSRRCGVRFVADFEFLGRSQHWIDAKSLTYDSVRKTFQDVGAASLTLRVASQLEYQPTDEDSRQMVGGLIVTIADSQGKEVSAYLSDLSDFGAGVLSDSLFNRGENVTIKVRSHSSVMEYPAEVRYSVKSKIAPGMFRSGLKLAEYGRLESAVWRNILKAA
jgi:hypothetical protein